eukprot:gene14114-biopygen3571
MCICPETTSQKMPERNRTRAGIEKKETAPSRRFGARARRWVAPQSVAGEKRRPLCPVRACVSEFHSAARVLSASAFISPRDLRTRARQLALKKPMLDACGVVLAAGYGRTPGNRECEAPREPRLPSRPEQGYELRIPERLPPGRRGLLRLVGKAGHPGSNDVHTGYHDVQAPTVSRLQQ